MKLSLILSVLACCGVSGAFAQSSGLPDGYVRNLTPHSHGVRFSTGAEPVRAGRISERYELRHGDCGGDDCRNPRFRSEIRQSPARTRARIGQDIWYGWSFYNENVRSYPGRTSLMTVFGQWKMGGSNPPNIKLVQVGHREAYRNGNPNHDVVIQMDDASEGLGWGRAGNWGIVCRLFSIEQARGRWTDIVLNTNFSTSEDGYLRVWINGEQRCDYAGPVVVTTDRSLYPGPNHRRGIYVSFTKRWQEQQPDTPYPTQIVYYDEFRVGRSRDEVDIRRIEQAGGAAVD